MIISFDLGWRPGRIDRFCKNLSNFAYLYLDPIVLRFMSRALHYFSGKSLNITLLLTLWLLASPVIPVHGQFYQGYQTNFGKNRVQYNDFYRTFYRFKSFDTYFYVGGKELAGWVGRYAGKEIENVENLFDYRVSGRLQFMIYNRYSDLVQTNIGLEGDEMSGNTGGLTRVMGNKVLLYFDGSHEHLLQQIRAGTAQVLLHQLLYGGNIKDRIQSAVLLTIPGWYEKGLIAFVAKGWNTDEDNRMRDGIISGRYKKFNRLLETEEEFAGQSMWQYITQTYGMSAIPNLLYMTRISRGIQGGFVNVLGVNLKKLNENWYAYYRKYYENDDKKREPSPEAVTVKKFRNNRVYHHFRLSPDGRYASYVSNDLGKYRVHITDLQNGKTRKVVKGGYRSLQRRPDYSYPLLSWHPSGQHLTIMRERKGNIWMEYHKTDRSKPHKEKFQYFDKVLSINYSPNGQEIVLSGVQKGESDIYVYNVRNRQSINLTGDIYDDLQPSFSADGDKIYFVSNRIKDTLHSSTREFDSGDHQFDVYSLSYPDRSGVLTRLTQTPLANEMQPLSADSGRILYLSDANGIYNRYTAVIDSAISYIDTVEHYRYFVETFPQTNYSRNLMEHDLNRRQNKYGGIFLNNGRYQIHVTTKPILHLAKSIHPDNTSFRQQTARRYVNEKRSVPAASKTAPSPPQTPVIVKSEAGEKSKTTVDSSKIDINNYVFQSEFQKPQEKKKVPVAKEEPSRVSEPDSINDNRNGIPTGKQVIIAPPDSFMLPTQRNYDVAFSTDYFVTQLDNNLQNATYQAFTGSAFYFDPGLNVLIKVGITDLFNDYKISGGLRLSGDFNSNEYFIGYENLKHRIDKTVAFYRLAREYVSAFSYLKIHTHEIKGQLKYPFNDLTSLRGSLSFRTDRIVTLATDNTNLSIPNVNNYWGSGKVEYIYDNTLNKGLNLWNGLRYKAFAEVFRQIDRDDSWVGVVGLDIRNYQKIHRQMILATRFAASTSFGDEKLVYYLGSTDNSIVPTDNFDYSIDIDYSQNYVFQAVATNIRGFLQNIRNGNSFALVNAELRVPLFQYLLNKPIRSDLIRNFQVVGFLDVGSAWNGSSPYSKDNAFNTEVIPGNPVTVELDRQVEPIVAGFGAGLRTRLFGYFLRGDWGWGYEDGVIRKPIFYLSLGLDF